MENEKKSSASVFLALIIGIILGIACFFVYKNYIAPSEATPTEEVDSVEVTQPIETEEPTEVSFLENLKTSILDTFEVEDAPAVILEEEPIIEDEVYFGEEESDVITEDDLLFQEEPQQEKEPVMIETEEMLETLLDETPAPVVQEPSELEELIEEPMMELKLPSTGPDPAMM